MGMNVYGKKELEDEDFVLYNYGCNYDELKGKIKFNKKTLELTIVSTEGGNVSDWAPFKIASKIKKTYQDTGVFPDKPISAS